MKQFLKDKTKIHAWLEQNIEGYYPEVFKITARGVISSSERVTVKPQNLDALPVKFGKVRWFSCKGVGLKTLEGSPNIVDELFDCSYNNLTNLVGGPQKVTSYHCFHNELTSLKGAPEFVKMNFNCSYNLLKTLEHITPEIGQSLYCEHNHLKTMAFSPKKVGSLVFAQFNEIEDWAENFKFFKEILLGKQRTNVFKAFEDEFGEVALKFDFYKTVAQANQLKKELGESIQPNENAKRLIIKI